MRKFLTAFAVTLLISTSAFARHLPSPIVGQEREERVTVCKTLDDVAKWTSSAKFKAEGKSPKMFIVHLMKMVKEKRCGVARVKYNVDKVIKQISTPSATDTGWGAMLKLYLLEITSPSGKKYFVITS